jgi:enoyl-CoA hydratase
MDSLELEVEGPVATLTLKGPGKGNALGPAFFAEMPEAFGRIAADENIRAVILRGSGKAFTYGLDLLAMFPEFGPLLTPDAGAAQRTALLGLIGRMQHALNVVADCPRPVIAAIHGWCIGGGVDLVSACDLRLCSADASFSVREVKLAMVADLGSLQRLPPIIGQGNTRELAFTGKDIDAGRALQMGLVNTVHPTPEALFVAAREMAHEIAANPPLAVAGIKQVLNEQSERTARAGLAHVAVWNSAFLPSLDLQEAFGAFAQKRPPRFEGK